MSQKPKGDNMELVIALVVIVALGALIYFNRSAKSLDINQDGRVDLADAAKAVENTTEGVKKTVKKAAVQAKTAARSTTRRSGTRKPAGKKTAPKK